MTSGRQVHVRQADLHHPVRPAEQVVVGGVAVPAVVVDPPVGGLPPPRGPGPSRIVIVATVCPLLQDMFRRQISQDRQGGGGDGVVQELPIAWPSSTFSWQLSSRTRTTHCRSGRGGCGHRLPGQVLQGQGQGLRVRVPLPTVVGVGLPAAEGPVQGEGQVAAGKAAHQHHRQHQVHRQGEGQVPPAGHPLPLQIPPEPIHQIDQQDEQRQIAEQERTVPPSADAAEDTKNSARQRIASQRTTRFSRRSPGPVSAQGPPRATDSAISGTTAGRRAGSPPGG